MSTSPTPPPAGPPTGPRPPAAPRWGDSVPGRPGRRPAAPPPTPEQLRDRLWLFVVMLVALILITPMALPFRLAGLLLVAPVAVIGVRLLIAIGALARTGRPVRGRLAVSIGLGLTALMTVGLLADAVFYPFNADLERCQAEAITHTARTACQEEQKRRLEDLQERLRGGARG